MSGPFVSVIIPTYGGAGFIGDAIRSVLDQTYSNLEVIVVDDVSPDHTSEVVAQFNDPRIKYIRHEVNQGAASARGTGRRASSGEILFFLDQDDLFHPEKIEAHVDFLKKHPEIGFTYSPYFEQIHSSTGIRTISMPPKEITLTELTLSFWLPPSSWVVRREWAFQPEIWDEYVTLRGREIVVCGRLFLAGCKFARIDRVLHYRGYHARRSVRELAKNREDELACQEIIFSDPRCPDAVKALRPAAKTTINVMWADVAFTQRETGLGRLFLRESAKEFPAFFDGNPSPHLQYLMGYCVDDESYDYEKLLALLFSQLPGEMRNIMQGYFWAVARGSYLRGIRALIWGRPMDAARHLAKASRYDFRVDEDFVQRVTHELLGYEMAMGSDAAAVMLEKLAFEFKDRFTPGEINWIKASYFFVKGNQWYLAGELGMAGRNVIRVFGLHPPYIFDRGILSVFLKSIVGMKPR